MIRRGGALALFVFARSLVLVLVISVALAPSIASAGTMSSGSSLELTSPQPIKVTALSVCPTCGGVGRVFCFGCGGLGTYPVYSGESWVQLPCLVCSQTGRLTCSTCGGTGQVVVADPVMRLTPTSLTFTAVEGAGNPAAQSITLACDSPPAAGWSAQTHNEQLASWVTEANSSNANTFNYTVNTAGLTPGKYTTSMQVEMWKGANSSYGHVQGSPYTFPITLTITPKPTAPPMPTTVRDPSFDLWSNGWLGIGRGFDHWDAWSSGALSPTQEYRSTVARTGAYAAGLSNTRSDPTYIEEIYQEVGVTPGYSYTLGAYSMTNRNPACVQLRLAFSNAANKSLVTLSTAGNQWGLGAGAWSRLRVTGVAPPGATHAVLDMRLTGGTYGGSSSGWALWDDVSWDRSAVPVTSGAGATATSISRPTLSTPRPKRGKYVTSSAVLTPGAAASGTSTKLLLYRQETKTVRKRVRGKMRKVKVKYWRLRSTIPMTPGAVGASTGFTAKYKLKYAGKWQAIASFGGGGGYAETKSSAKSFTAR